MNLKKRILKNINDFEVAVIVLNCLLHLPLIIIECS